MQHRGRITHGGGNFYTFGKEIPKNRFRENSPLFPRLTFNHPIMEQKDIRWQQRLSNYKKALAQMEKFVAKGDSLSELEEQGLIKSFEYTYELGWNTLKDYLIYQGFTEIIGSRDAIRESFSAGLIEDGEVWMDMLKSRNKTSHTYNEETAKQVVKAILNDYFPVFNKLKARMETIKDNTTT